MRLSVALTQQARDNYDAIFATKSLCKAPQPGMGEKLLQEGFSPSDFSVGDKCAYFFTRLDGAVRNYAHHYGEGILEVLIPNGIYEQRIKQHEKLYQGGPEVEVVIPHSEFEILNNSQRVLHEC